MFEKQQGMQTASPAMHPSLAAQYKLAEVWRSHASRETLRLLYSRCVIGERHQMNVGAGSRGVHHLVGHTACFPVDQGCVPNQRRSSMLPAAVNSACVAAQPPLLLVRPRWDAAAACLWPWSQLTAVVLPCSTIERPPAFTTTSVASTAWVSSECAWATTSTLSYGSCRHWAVNVWVCGG